MPKVLLRHQGKKFVITEKVDGTSMTIYLTGMEMGGEFGVCSRNLNLKEEGETAYWKYVREHKIEELMRAVAAKNDAGLLNFSLQGELVGPGIQGNKYGLEQVQFFVFNVYDIMKASYLSMPYELIRSWGLQHVPLITEDYLLPPTVDEMVEYSRAKSLLNKTIWREGIVARSVQEEFDEDLGRLSFKVINPEFLLKYNE